MNSFQESQRQIRIALVILATIIPIGVFGFMILEKFSLLDSIWLTVITLATIGYGDIYAHTPEGRVFTLLLILFGIGAVAYGLQATASFLFSPAIRDLRQRRRTQNAIDRLRNHYVICGAGELVDNTIKYLLEGAKRRQEIQRNQIYLPVDHFLDGIFGDDAQGHFPRLRAILRRVFMFFVWIFHRSRTLLDVVVVVTPSHEFADHLRNNNLLVIEGDPTSDEILKRAGINNAYATMVMLDNDTEALLTVLTARNLNPQLDITAATLEEQLAPKMIRVGANGVIAPYEVAGQFLNNATLRPAVNEFFNSILFSQRTDYQATQLSLWDDSRWIRQRLGKLNLRERFQAGVIGLRLENGTFMYAPSDDYILKENEVLIAVAPAQAINSLQQACREGTAFQQRVNNWQRLPLPTTPPRTEHPTYTLAEAEAAIQDMSGHFIVAGVDRVGRNAISKLDPMRPFVIISDDEAYTGDLLRLGFRVIHGNPAQESVLRKAGVARALAVMVTSEDQASSVLTVINCRALSKRLLITATAQGEDMIPKLRRAGADRVVTPFQVAAQFVLLATTRPAVSDFVQYVVYNYSVRLETTELYMQDDSPWIGQTLESLLLDRLFRAGVVGIRLADGQYLYAPPADYVLQPHEVLIVVTPMEHSDELRITAHGSVTKRPVSLRHGYFEARG
jgi:voltage-gated potassium channel